MTDLGAALSTWARNFYDSADNALIERPDDKLVRAAAKLADMAPACIPTTAPTCAASRFCAPPFPASRTRIASSWPARSIRATAAILTTTSRC